MIGQLDCFLHNCLTVELELFRKGQLTADDEEEELEDPKAVAALSTEASADPGKYTFSLIVYDKQSHYVFETTKHHVFTV